MSGKVPGATGTHSHHHAGGSRSLGKVAAHQGHSDPQPAGVLYMEGMTFVAPSRPVVQEGLTPCPSRGLEVRYFYLTGHKPACEVWKAGTRLNPPPYLTSRADKTKNDTILREGDTLDFGTIRESDLTSFGFESNSTNPLIALLFFIMDIGSDTQYRVLLTVQKIIPRQSSQWDGRVIFLRSIVAGDAVLPVPNQSGWEEDLKGVLTFKQIVEPMVALANVIESFEGLMMDFIWGLTGGWEVKVAGEVAEKYVAKQVIRRVLKYLRPKFLAIAKAYIEGFVKEIGKQICQRIVDAVRMAASQKLFNSAVPADGAITVEAIHWLQSSKKLSETLDHSKMDWEKCHAKGMEEGLKPFWKLFADKRFATGPIRRFLMKCTEPIEKFFFKLGLLKVLEKAEGAMGKKINSLIVELTEWIAEKVKPGKPVTAEEVQAAAANKLGDGTLINLVVKYFEDNWEKFAKSALETVEKEFIKALRGAAA